MLFVQVSTLGTNSDPTLSTFTSKYELHPTYNKDGIEY